MRQPMWLIFLVVGIVIALFGIASLLPGASPGFDLPQLLAVAAGLALLIVAALVRRGGRRRSIKRRTRRSLAVALVITLVTIIALELLLTASGVTVHYPAVPAHYELRALPWWVCGDAGCHYDYDAVQPACESGQLEGRVCAINRQGYADSADFVLPDDHLERTRILLLGDSVTWGMSADLGASYAETLSAAFPDAIIWNTGIPGTGANQARMVFEVYAPVLRPQLTILGFVNNDFDDNLLPVDSWINALDSSGRAIHLRKYAIDDDENVIAFDLRDLAFIQAHQTFPPRSALEAQLGSTRLGSLLLRLRDKMKSAAPADEKLTRRRQVTKQHLMELKRAVVASGSEFLVILVPGPADIVSAGPRYQMAEELMQELEIAFLNPASILHPVADYAPPPDFHWSNAGHQKVGALLSDCVQRYFDSGSLANCEHVIIF